VIVGRKRPGRPVAPLAGFGPKLGGVAGSVHFACKNQNHGIHIGIDRIDPRWAARTKQDCRKVDAGFRLKILRNQGNLSKFALVRQRKLA
jgi:hypothetical protein